LLRLPREPALVDEPELAVEGDGTRVVRVHSEAHLLDVVAPGPPQRLGEERAADPSAAMVPQDRHPEGGDVAVVAPILAADPDAPDDPAVRHGHDRRRLLGHRATESLAVRPCAPRHLLGGDEPALLRDLADDVDELGRVARARRADLDTGRDL